MVKTRRRPLFTVLALAILLASAFFGGGQARAQSLGTWNLLNVRYTLDKKWSFFAEAQLRSLRTYDHFFYHELKGGFNYEVSDHFRAGVAVGHYDTYGAGGDFVQPKVLAEWRIWPHALMYHSIGRIKVEHRYRVEFRLREQGFRERFRYRLGLTLPFGKDTHGYRPFMVTVADELFFSTHAPYFERNRFTALAGWKPSKPLMLQLGYIHHHDYRLSGLTQQGFLFVGGYVELKR